jgi:branched-chain amino acid transport system ATP-binding protein
VKYYGKIQAVEDLSIRVETGQVVALIGPNGAGKTSSLRAVGGFLGREPGSVTAGDILFEGRSIRAKQPFQIAGLGIALVPERDKVFLELTPLEHFQLCRSGPGRSRFQEDMDRVLALFPDLKLHLRRPAGYFSGGQRQMLAFASALFSRPRLLLVDEFSQGLAPILVQSLRSSVEAMNTAGMTILLVEQNTSLALAMAHRLYVLDGGRVVAQGSADELRAAGDMTSAYLGTKTGS